MVLKTLTKSFRFHIKENYHEYLKEIFKRIKKEINRKFQ